MRSAFAVTCALPIVGLAAVAMADPVPAPATLLSHAGLYQDISTRRVVSHAIEFQPAHQLWSDGAEKRRWLVLPVGTVIDTSDMNHWRFPIGTRLFKEFAADGMVLETRMLEHRGPRDEDVVLATYVWRRDGSDAVLTTNGVRNVRGTRHDVPRAQDCSSCHDGEPSRVLGFSAVQLSRPDGVTIATLAAQGLLSHPPATGTSFAPPGPPEVARALGMLHGNCGHCHNPYGAAFHVTPAIDMVLRLDVYERSVEDTQLYRTSVGRLLTGDDADGETQRIVPGHPETSELVHRMSIRGVEDQMPPLGTERVDRRALGLVTEWIRSLPAR